MKIMKINNNNNNFIKNDDDNIIKNNDFDNNENDDEQIEINDKIKKMPKAILPLILEKLVYKKITKKRKRSL